MSEPEQAVPELMAPSRMQGESRPLLVARGIRKSFGGHHVLRDACFALRPGEVVLLRGENGSGKTTLLNILTGNLAPDGGDGGRSLIHKLPC